MEDGQRGLTACRSGGESRTVVAPMSIYGNCRGICDVRTPLAPPYEDRPTFDSMVLSNSFPLDGGRLGWGWQARRRTPPHPGPPRRGGMEK